MALNYKLIYDYQTYREQELHAQRKLDKAKAELKAAEESSWEFLRSLLKPGEMLRDSNVGCIAKGIPYHVYKGKEGMPKGVGHWHCVFCGCDDGDM